MYIIKVDFEKCDACNICEVMLPGFRSLCGGIKKVDSGAKDEEILAAAKRIKECCPAEAIILTYYEDDI